ncbi:hypothetical protein [Streptomyces sp. NPDC056937]|uniref:hypothetical protein n=1 Tax=Streptomyces sp. NPDC056937 TaxID=3345969 RepID=UPI0036382859
MEHRPGEPTKGDVGELVARIAAGDFYRLRLAPEEVAKRQRERWEDTPHETWFSKWSPLPAGVYRGPYAKPTRAVLRDVEAGLRRRLTDE